MNRLKELLHVKEEVSFTRQHFDKVAHILKTATLDDKVRAGLAREFATMFSDDNPNFSIDRFMTAVGVKG